MWFGREDNSLGEMCRRYLGAAGGDGGFSAAWTVTEWVRRSGKEQKHRLGQAAGTHLMHLGYSWAHQNSTLTCSVSLSSLSLSCRSSSSMLGEWTDNGEFERTSNVLAFK